jgi:hypothetical protein
MAGLTDLDLRVGILTMLSLLKLEELKLEKIQTFVSNRKNDNIEAFISNADYCPISGRI